MCCLCAAPQQHPTAHVPHLRLSLQQDGLDKDSVTGADEGGVAGLLLAPRVASAPALQGRALDTEGRCGVQLAQGPTPKPCSGLWPAPLPMSHLLLTCACPVVE